MIVVDSSEWVAGFRGDASIRAELTRLLHADLVALASPVRTLGRSREDVKTTTQWLILGSLGVFACSQARKPRVKRLPRSRQTTYDAQGTSQAWHFMRHFDAVGAEQRFDYEKAKSPGDTR